jgi:predicted O-methyltransferase YrrM
MDIFDSTLEQYLSEHSTTETAVLQALNRETHLKVLQPNMLSGQVQGQFLKMISQMICPKYILEIGTYTGYSAICLAEGLQAGGHLHTIDVNEEMKSITQKYFDLAGLTAKITLHIGDALEIIPQLDFIFDLVFMDADKLNYPNYFDLALPKVRQGGVILIDNVLWKGKILDLETNNDKKTLAMHAFNQKTQADERVENVILPLRDGVMMVRKK